MRFSPALLISSLVVATACSDSVGPRERALDGAWSSPLAVSGLALVLTLDWTRDHVAGSGGYGAADAGVRCGPVTIRGDTALVFTADRPSPNEIRGQMRFGSGAPIAYEGTLIDTMQVQGFARIEGALVAPDGTRCPLALFQGLIP